MQKPLSTLLIITPCILFAILVSSVPYLLSLCMQSKSVTIQVKATEKRFSVVITFDSVDEILKLAIQRKAT